MAGFKENSDNKTMIETRSEDMVGEADCCQEN
jgi:hypothetical protein